MEIVGSAGGAHRGCFQQIWLFEGAPHDAMCAVSNAVARKTLAAGEDLFRQGDRAESLYLIKMGSVKLWKISEDGRVVTLDIRKSGDRSARARSWKRATIRSARPASNRH